MKELELERKNQGIRYCECHQQAGLWLLLGFPRNKQGHFEKDKFPLGPKGAPFCNHRLVELSNVQSAPNTFLMCLWGQCIVFVYGSAMFCFRYKF